jgi:hypothetical protein
MLTPNLTSLSSGFQQSKSIEERLEVRFRRCPLWCNRRRRSSVAFVQLAQKNDEPYRTYVVILGYGKYDQKMN